jgi:hypothetical protein
MKILFASTPASGLCLQSGKCLLRRVTRSSAYLPTRCVTALKQSGQRFALFRKTRILIYETSLLYLSIASRPKAGEVVDASQPDPPRGRGARALNHTNDCLRFTKDASLLDRRLFSARGAKHVRPCGRPLRRARDCAKSCAWWD